MIDLRSDTLTQPSPQMRQLMADAAVGDDVYGEDPTVNELERYAAEVMHKAAGLFVPSGTQSNLLALLTHCQRGDEYIVAQEAHTYRFEGGGAAVLGGIQPQPLALDEYGALPLKAVEANIKPDDFHFAKTRLVCVENTCGGRVLDLTYLAQARTLCDRHGLQLHMDGARFFNACVALECAPAAMADFCDTVSICLSKGLGAPVGSVLVGPEDFIEQARRWRKMLGGGMRQAGIIGAAGLYALQHNRARLADDHAHAALVAQSLRGRFADDHCVQHATNMLHVKLPEPQYQRLAKHLLDCGIRANRPRWVFHLDVTDKHVEQIVAAIESCPT